MARTRTSTLLLATVLGFGSAQAWAQTQLQCHSRTLPLTSPNWANSITVPRFDPALGTLVSVGLTARAHFQGSVAFENTDLVSPVMVASTLSMDLSVRRPDLSTIVQASPSVNFNDVLNVFDGVIDFAGPSGVTHVLGDIFSVEGASLPTLPSDLALFAGPSGAPGSISLPVLSSSLFFFTGGGSMTALSTNATGVDIDICYTYDPSQGLRTYRTNTARAPGRMVDNFIVVENLGSATVTDVDVIESVDPRFFRLVEMVPAGIIDTPRLAALGIVVWRIPSIAPGEVVALNYRARLDPLTPLGTNIPGGPLWAGFDLVDTWLDCTATAQEGAPDCACASLCCSGACAAGPVGCLTCRADCILGCGTAGSECLRATRDAIIACFDAALGVLARHQDDSPAIGPFDPNEKRVGNRPSIRSGETIVYAVHYENVGTLEALDVFVRDTLDPNLDISTVEFPLGPVGTVDVATRTVAWDLVGINLPPGETDNVMFTVRPLSGLPPGSVVRNRGRIQFETTPAIETNEVVNVVDPLRPRGTMTPLPPTIPTEDIPLSWDGQDLLDTGLTYSIYVSENGGLFRPHLLDSPDTSAVFVGHVGSSYEFFCIAQDAAGNVELQNPTGEAFTTVVDNDAAQFCAGDGSAGPCPCGNFSLPGSGEGCANSLGMGGKLVVSGTASISTDTLRLLGSRMTNGTALYFQGTEQENGGLGVRLGDGLLCAGGSIVRILMKPNSGGASTYPEPGDLPLSTIGTVQPGDVRTYQCWYRNAAQFCTSKPFNTTNGVRVTWGP